MHSGSKALQLATIVFLFPFTPLVVEAFADNCRDLSPPSQNRTLNDRELYVRLPGRTAWLNMKEAQPNLGRQQVEFAYVVVETFDEARSGVLVIKSGRLRPLDEPPATRRVRLVRAHQNIDNGNCGVVPTFPESSVSTRSYDDYHDRGLKVAETATLDAFHFRYVRRGGCRRTNDASVDSISPYDPRSNLSQFSFDPAVVANGTYSQTLAWFKPTPAIASSDKLTDQRVEMMQYRALKGQPMCIRFRLSASGPGSFLRLNDLEAVRSNGVRFTRSDEQEWSLSQ